MGKLARLIVQPPDVLYDLLGIFQPKVGQYYPSIHLHAWGGGTRADVPANCLRAVYYPILRKCKFDRIGLRVVGAGGAGAKIRLGIYDDKDFYPNSLIVDAGEVDASTTGDKELTIDQTLEGAYWLVCNTNDATIDFRYPASFFPLWEANLQHWGCGYVISQTYGALPSTFPTGATITTWDAVSIFLRVAEVY